MAQSAYVDLGNLETGTFTDARDGNTYGWRAIGDRVWMTENFAYEGVGEYVLDRFGNHCYSYRPAIGRVEGLNPEGWHVSTYEDWNALEQYAASIGITDNSDFARSLAKVSDLWDYETGKPPLNTLKFDMIPAVWIPTRAVTGDECRFWTSTLGPSATSESTSVYAPIVHSLSRWDYRMEERSDDDRGCPVRLVFDHDASLLSPNLDLVLEPLDLQEVQVTVEQDIVVGSLSLILEALDVRVDNNFATDFDWIYDHSMLNSEKQPVRLGPVNDRLIDIERWLPGAFQGTQLASFVRLFQDFLNEQLYEENRKYTQGKRGVSVLKKIERILDLRDPNEIDEEFLYQYANLLGFDVHTLQALTTSLYKEDGFNHTRELLKSAPVIFSNKATEKMYNLILASFGHYIKITGLWTDNEDNYADGVFKTYSEIKDSDSSFAPTPHFGVVVDISKQDSEWTPTSEKVLGDTIEYFRPIDTVYEGTLLTYGSPFFFSRLEDGENTRNGMELTVLKPWALTSCGFDPSLFPKIKWWIDPRDGKWYEFEYYAPYGPGAPWYDVWMVRNFDYGETGQGNDPGYGKTYRTSETNGGVYTWTVAVQTCPNGWHVPAMGEFDVLTQYVYPGSPSTSSGSESALRMKSKPDAWDGTDTVGYNLLPSRSLKSNGEEAPTPFGPYTKLWTTSYDSSLSQSLVYHSSSEPTAVNIGGNYNYYYGSAYAPMAQTGKNYWVYDQTEPAATNSLNAVSVRYVRDRDENPIQTTGLFVDDRDGQIYRWAKIGDLYWMVDNLNYGTITTMSSGSELQYGDAWPLGDPDIPGSDVEGKVWLMRGMNVSENSSDGLDNRRLGKAYNRIIAEESCPKGWDLPSRAQWENLRDALMNSTSVIEYPDPDDKRRGWRTTDVGKKMKTGYGYRNYDVRETQNNNYGGSSFYGLPTGWCVASTAQNMLIPTKFDLTGCWLCKDVYESYITVGPSTHQSPSFVTVNSVDNESIQSGEARDSYMYFYGDLPYEEGTGKDFIGDGGDYAPRFFNVNPMTDIGFSIRCCRTTRPTMHTEEDPAKWCNAE